MANKRSLHNRGLVSFFTLFGFIIMAITGLVLYVVPEGRVAYWIDWRFAFLSRPQWSDIHILSSLLFVVAGVFHTVLNWKPLLNYFKDRLTSSIKLRRELAIASSVSVLVIVSSLYPIPPLSYLLDLNSAIKKAWITQPEYEPPFGHAELLSLKGFTTKMQIPLDSALQELSAKGLTVSGPSQSLLEISQANNVTPLDVYMVIKKYEPQPEPDIAYTPESVEVQFAGTGIGNQTVVTMCEKAGVPIQTAMSRLSAVGLSAQPDQTLKEVAAENSTTPIDILTLMLTGSHAVATEPGSHAEREQ